MCLYDAFISYTVFSMLLI